MQRQGMFLIMTVETDLDRFKGSTYWMLYYASMPYALYNLKPGNDHTKTSQLHCQSASPPSPSDSDKCCSPTLAALHRFQGPPFISNPAYDYGQLATGIDLPCAKAPLCLACQVSVSSGHWVLPVVSLASLHPPQHAPSMVNQ